MEMMGFAGSTQPAYYGLALSQALIDESFSRLGDAAGLAVAAALFCAPRNTG
jgi:hypothetical protein